MNMEANFYVLTTDYQPVLNSDFLFRTEEYKTLLAYTEPYTYKGNIWFEGKKGLGKTTLCKQFMSYVNASGKAFVVYVPVEPSPSKMKTKLAKHFGIVPYSYTDSALAKKIAEKGDVIDENWKPGYIPQQPPKPLVVIFDEVEKLYDRNNNAAITAFDDWITNLWNCWVQDLHVSCYYVLMGTTSPVLQNKFFADTSLSRYQWKWKVFPKYTAPEIFEILKMRIEKCSTLDGNPISYHEQVLRKITRVTYRRWESDVRQALDTLITAITEANGTITVAVAEKAIEIHKREWWKAKLAQLGFHASFLLYVCALKGKAKTETIKKIYQKRCHIEGIDPLARSSLYHIFNDLFTRGFIEMWTEPISKGKRGQQKRLWIEMPDADDKRRIAEAGEAIYGILDIYIPTPKRTLESYPMAPPKEERVKLD